MMLCLRQSGIPVIGTPYYFHIPNLSLNDLPIDIGLYFPPSEQSRITNTNGYWEVVSLSINNGLTDRYKDIGFNGDLIKVFASVLTKSNPDLINKTIIMLREPRAMISSMITAGEFSEERASEASGVLAWYLKDAIGFLKKHKKDYMVVVGERMLKKPRAVMKKVCEFLGRGDYRYGAEMINKSLNRAVPRNDLGDISPLEEVYQLALENKL